MSPRPEDERLVAVLRTALGTPSSDRRIIRTMRPVGHFIDWLDEPDLVLDADEGMLYIWKPVRLAAGSPPGALAIIDCGNFRGVLLGNSQHSEAVRAALMSS